MHAATVNIHVGGNMTQSTSHTGLGGVSYATTQPLMETSTARSLLPESPALHNDRLLALPRLQQLLPWPHGMTRHDLVAARPMDRCPQIPQASFAST